MKRFDWHQQREAIRYAAAGGQALHVHRFGVSESAPAVFRDAVKGRKNIAHLFDWDAARLRETTYLLGVRRIHIDRLDGAGQHTDLVGEPLKDAIELCHDAERSYWKASGYLWLVTNRRRPLLVTTDSPITRWNWIGTWPTARKDETQTGWRRWHLQRSRVRGSAWFRESVGVDDRARLTDRVFDLLVYHREPHCTLMKDERGRVAGVMFMSSTEAKQRLREVFPKVRARDDLDALLGRWADPIKDVEIDCADYFSDRFQTRFLRHPTEADFRMAFGRPMERSA